MVKKLKSLPKVSPPWGKVGKPKPTKMNTAIIFDHRGRSTENGPIEIRVRINRKTFYINTGVSVKKRNFVGGTIINQLDSRELNARVSILYKKVQEELNFYIKEGLEPDVAEIRRRVWTMGNESKSDSTPLLDFIEEQERVMNVSDGTIAHYKTLRMRLIEFGLMTRWSDLAVENIYKFDAWLHQLKSNHGNIGKKEEDKKRISDGAVYNYHKNFRAILNKAVLYEKIERNPYERLRGQFRRGDKENTDFLTEEEMAAIESIRPVYGTLMAAVRDLFVFQMHTGLSYADTQAFDFSQYRKVNGKWVTVGNRVKTGEQYVTQLSDECLKILERYDWTLPKIQNVKYNVWLKTLATAAGIEKNLHSHLARHSFATRMIAHGAAIQNVSKMLGHANIKQTQRYATVQPESVFADFDRVQNKKNGVS